MSASASSTVWSVVVCVCVQGSLTSQRSPRSFPFTPGSVRVMTWQGFSVVIAAKRRPHLGQHSLAAAVTMRPRQIFVSFNFHFYQLLATMQL